MVETTTWRTPADMQQIKPWEKAQDLVGTSATFPSWGCYASALWSRCSHIRHVLKPTYDRPLLSGALSLAPTLTVAGTWCE
jgi:hypothetical protein